jgi:hypothetical protein
MGASRRHGESSQMRVPVPSPRNIFVDLGVSLHGADPASTAFPNSAPALPSPEERKDHPEEADTFEVVVDQMPTRAGIDPYNKLIDRISDDNLIDVSKP